MSSKKWDQMSYMGTGIRTSSRAVGTIPPITNAGSSPGQSLVLSICRLRSDLSLGASARWKGATLSHPATGDVVLKKTHLSVLAFNPLGIRLHTTKFFVTFALP